jgi:hypothetical protein
LSLVPGGWVMEKKRWLSATASVGDDIWHESFLHDRYYDMKRRSNHGRANLAESHAAGL